LTQGNCFYCGNPPSQKVSPRGCYGSYIYNGIDRKLSSEGYTITNSLSCCFECNKTKSNTPYPIFIEWLKKSYNHLKTSGEIK